MPVRLPRRVRSPHLSAPIWVAIIGAGSVILVAAVQFVIAPLLFRAEPPARSQEPARKVGQTSATSLDSSPKARSQRSSLSSDERRRNFQLLASPAMNKGVRTFRG